MTGQQLLELLFRLDGEGTELRNVKLIFEMVHPETETRVHVIPGQVERDDDGHLIFR